MSGPVGLHHVELWVADLDVACAQWGWLLTGLGYEPYQDWTGSAPGTGGRSWRLGEFYLVIERSPARSGPEHDRLADGLNHLALWASRDQVDQMSAEASVHGWRVLFADRHPYAGGPDHYAAYLENTDGFEVELVATQ